MTKEQEKKYEIFKKQQRIIELKGKLTETDYQAIKYAEGEMTDEEYEPIRLQRKAWRNEINELEEQLKCIKE